MFLNTCTFWDCLSKSRGLFVFNVFNVFKYLKTLKTIKNPEKDPLFLIVFNVFKYLKTLKTLKTLFLMFLNRYLLGLDKQSQKVFNVFKNIKNN